MDNNQQFTIQITYQTGNSFGTEEQTEDVGPTWDLPDAKQALKDIVAHNEATQAVNGSWSKVKEEDYKNESWYIKEFWVYALLAGGKHVHAFWHGYFETLLEARVVPVEELDDEMSWSRN